MDNRDENIHRLVLAWSALLAARENSKSLSSKNSPLLLPSPCHGDPPMAGPLTGSWDSEESDGCFRERVSTREGSRDP